MMTLQIGEIQMTRVTKEQVLDNKTMKYLLPCLKSYGNEFTTNLNNVYKVGVGIGDLILDKCGFKHEKHLFILVDSIIAPFHFNKFIGWIKDQPMYQDDYIFGNIQKSSLHMIVIKLPDQYATDTFSLFKAGSYSNMYSLEDVERLFQNHPDVKKVLVKDHNYKIKFVKELNKEYLSSLATDEWEGELDFPPKEQEEKFNTYLK